VGLRGVSCVGLFDWRDLVSKCTKRVARKSARNTAINVPYSVTVELSTVTSVFVSVLISSTGFGVEVVVSVAVWVVELVSVTKLVCVVVT
jgi:hypothetical protein